MEIRLKKFFSSNSKVDEYDVSKIKHALNRLGYYVPFEKVGMTGISDKAVFAGLKLFQKDHDLQVTGEVRPNDATIQKLNQEIAKKPEGKYIWRTVDDDKVRSSHALLNRKIRSWGEFPDPTEEYNCRCWAEPISGPEIEKEELPPPNIEGPKIPGTNIPDEGIPEGWVPLQGPFIGDRAKWRYEIDPELERRPSLFDPHILIPHNPNYPVLTPRPNKPRI